MRHSMLLAAALVGTSFLADPAAAQKKGVGPAPQAAPRAKAAPAAPAAAARTLDLDALAASASLDPAAKARVAPHVAAMNVEWLALRGIMAQFSGTQPRARQDSMHKALKTHYDAFDRHWKEADALIPAQRRAAFDAAVRQQMGGRNPAAVGNPHQNLPAAHPKLNRQGGPAKK